MKHTNKNTTSAVQLRRSGSNTNISNASTSEEIGGTRHKQDKYFPLNLMASNDVAEHLLASANEKMLHFGNIM